ncbi:MAG: helix-turn-helix domain-containing protein [Flavobacteriales bacterium Tduv]
MVIFEKIKQVRKVLKMSQKELAETIGVSQKDVSLLENGKKEFIPRKYFEYFLSQGIDLNSLFYEDTDVRFIEKMSKVNSKKSNRINKNKNYLIIGQHGTLPVFQEEQKKYIPQQEIFKIQEILSQVLKGNVVPVLDKICRNLEFLVEYFDEDKQPKSLKKEKKQSR